MEYNGEKHVSFNAQHVFHGVIYPCSFPTNRLPAIQKVEKMKMILDDSPLSKAEPDLTSATAKLVWTTSVKVKVVWFPYKCSDGLITDNYNKTGSVITYCLINSPRCSAVDISSMLTRKAVGESNMIF